MDTSKTGGGGAAATQIETHFPGSRLRDVRVGTGSYLSHWSLDGVVYHICFRLSDSVPQEKLRAWQSEREEFERQRQAGVTFTEDELRRLRYLYSENVERYLDSGYGSCLLRCGGAFAAVVDTFKHGDGTDYRLHAYGVMPNHAHVGVAFRSSSDMAKAVQAWKSVSAHRINRLLGRKGTVWQDDYYNHIIRSEEEYRFQMNYIAGNNVLASWRRDDVR